MTKPLDHRALQQTAMFWTPQARQIVHVARANRWNLSAGRYRVAHYGGARYGLDPIAGGEGIPIACETLRDAERMGTITVIDPEQDRLDQQRVNMRLQAGLRRGDQLEPGPLFDFVDQERLEL